MEDQKKDDIILEVHDGFIGFDEIEERAARRRNEELKQSEEVKDDGETGQ